MHGPPAVQACVRYRHWHVLVMHSWLRPHIFPQAPQFAASDPVDLQPSEQSIWPEAHDPPVPGLVAPPAPVLPPAPGRLAPPAPPAAPAPVPPLPWFPPAPPPGPCPPSPALGLPPAPGPTPPVPARLPPDPAALMPPVPASMLVVPESG